MGGRKNRKLKEMVITLNLLPYGKGPRSQNVASTYVIVLHHLRLCDHLRVPLTEVLLLSDPPDPTWEGWRGGGGEGWRGGGVEKWRGGGVEGWRSGGGRGGEVEGWRSGGGRGGEVEGGEVEGGRGGEVEGWRSRGGRGGEVEGGGGKD